MILRRFCSSLVIRSPAQLSEDYSPAGHHKPSQHRPDLIWKVRGASALLIFTTLPTKANKIMMCSESFFGVNSTQHELITGFERLHLTTSLLREKKNPNENFNEREKRGDKSKHTSLISTLTDKPAPATDCDAAMATVYIYTCCWRLGIWKETTNREVKENQTSAAWHQSPEIRSIHQNPQTRISCTIRPAGPTWDSKRFTKKENK